MNDNFRELPFQAPVINTDFITHINICITCVYKISVIMGLQTQFKYVSCMHNCNSQSQGSTRLCIVIDLFSK
jgi:hypothetical protein